MQIEVNNLRYSYGEETAKRREIFVLNGIDLKIEEGDYYGIIGKTGSGKSTFVSHLNGLIKIKKNMGRVTVGEFDLTDKKCDFKKLRSKIGMVFQYPEYQLFAETIEDDVAFGVKNFMPTLTENEVKEKVKEALSLVGLDYDVYKEKSPFELSGGQKRRVAIAGVIATRPEVLVLDEPAAGLDPVGKREFLNLIKSLHNSFVKTVIIISHDMNLVAENCNRVAVFENGKVIKDGTPKQVYGELKNYKIDGLDLPVTAYLENELSKHGIEIDSDLTIDGFIKSACDKLMKGAKV